MAKDIQVKLKLSGVNKLMRSDGVQSEINKAAGRIAAHAGPKFQVHPVKHKWTARAFVEAKEGQTLTHKDRVALLAALNKYGA